jgi:two-component system, chemotaxis family, protein-glutamate methylesterase/glutaminase
MMEVSVVVVGTSLGGLSAMKVLLSGLPGGFRPPLVIVQHRSKAADDALVQLLRKQTSLAVSEPNDKDPLEAGHVYIAPVDYHLLVEPKSLALSTEAPVNYARPSIDVLFESAAETHGRGVVGVVLTGANEDGAIGAWRIKQRGGVVLVQDVASAEAAAMPAAAIAATNVDKVVPLAELPAVLNDLCLKRRK